MKINTLQKRLNTFIYILIGISIVIFSLETVPGIKASLGKAFLVVELIITVIFTLEYILRIVFSKKKLSYIFSFYGIIDLIAIVPFYFFHGPFLNSIRIVRCLKIIRGIKFSQFGKSIKRLVDCFLSIKNELIILLILSFILLYISAFGIYLFEHQAQPEKFKSIFHSLWWAVATLTTVGYGDVYPITVGGRIFTSIILMVGLGLISVPAGLFASALMKSKE